MKTRIISGVIGAVLAVVVLFFLPAYALNVAAAALAVVAVFEMLNTTGLMKHKGVLTACAVYAAAVLLYAVPMAVVKPSTVLLAAALCILQVVQHEKLQIEKVAYAFFATLFITFSFASLATLRQMEHGLLYVLLTMVIPWMSDTGAYFTGTFCGKHKLCPKVSPKKTVEGLIGGVVISVGCTVLTAWLYQHFAMPSELAVVWVRLVLIALVLAPLSVFGDLFASIIKRQTGIKDYGNLMPGHGGVMDRFDSVLPTASLLYVAISYLPLLEHVIHCN